MLNVTNSTSSDLDHASTYYWTPTGQIAVVSYQAFSVWHATASPPTGDPNWYKWDVFETHPRFKSVGESLLGRVDAVMRLDEASFVE